jgi:vanillate O-demethylase monooxygenase subunit
LEEQPRFPLPSFPQWERPSYTKVFIPCDTWSCSAARRVENYTDLSHFAFVHDGVLGDINHPEVPRHIVRRDKYALYMRALEPKLEPGRTKYELETDDLVETSQEWWIYMPLTVTFDQVGPNDRHYVLFFHATPVGPRTTRNFTIAARNYGNRDTLHDDTVAFMRLVYEQDRPVVESQRPEELSEDLSMEMHVRDVDALSVAYRQWLVELANELDSGHTPPGVPARVSGQRP